MIRPRQSGGGGRTSGVLILGPFCEFQVVLGIGFYGCSFVS